MLRGGWICLSRREEEGDAVKIEGNLSAWLTKTYGGVPTLTGAFVLGLVLLAYRDLDEAIRIRLVPALVVYVLGLGLLAFLYFALDARNVTRSNSKDEEAGPQRWYVFWGYIGAHAVWLLWFMRYLFAEGVL